jgi:diguanylate cyclase (GGDEF)-like protein
MEKKIHQVAYHDGLTALPNRVLFNNRLTTASAQARCNKQMLAVLFLDLDQFKSINDTLGYTAGDQLLQGIAGRLTDCVRKDDTVAHLRGDEFTLLLPEITHVKHMAEIARRVLETIKHPWIFGSHKLYTTASIGISLYPNDGEDTETLLKNAYTAMCRAKELGGNNYQFYTPAFEKLTMEIGLRHALERKEFVVYYQPKVDIYTRLVGMEALVRWQHPKLGLVSPAEFIPLAEDTRLIVPIDEWVLHTTCAQNKAWQDAGFLPVRMAVNLSAHTFHQQNLVETVTQTLKETGLDPHFLELEITEGTAIQNVETTVYKLKELNDLGIQIAIDDFGTGYSSLNYLKKFPIHTLKIAQSFVHNITIDPDDAAILTMIITLAKSLKLKVIAEGVETEEQLAFLKQLHCDEMQGFLFCEPAPAAAFEKILAQDKRLQDQLESSRESLLVSLPPCNSLPQPA